MKTVQRSRSKERPETTHVVGSIVVRDSAFDLPALKWGRDSELQAVKDLYATECVRHDEVN